MHQNMQRASLKLYHNKPRICYSWNMSNRIYVCIDLKSFYASVECVARNLDPLTTNLVVADPERTEKTICLAVSPTMKVLGVRNRCRVFEIPPNIDYIMAVPRMQLYIDTSAEIYAIYLKYIAKEDIYVYSIDEAFMDVTDYLSMYDMTAEQLTQSIIADVLDTTGITATGGIGTNLYLAKIAMDIVAKHSPNNIGILDEDSYCKRLWNHTPLTDFWRIGPGISRRLASSGMLTMGDVARSDLATLQNLFGIDGELIYDHAWGRETTTMQDIKSFRPKNNSVSSGQVLAHEYNAADGRLIVKEMADLLSLELVDKGLVTESVSLYIRYSERYGVPHSSGSMQAPFATSSAKVLIDCALQIYDRIVRNDIGIKGFNISYNHVSDEAYMQYNLFVDPADLEKENRMQKAMIELKDRYGKNAIVKGMNLQEKGTAMERNLQIGGHRK